MMKPQRFSKDPKVKLISVEEFLEKSDYLSDMEGHLWQEDQRPRVCTTYYKITPRFFILINYTAIRVYFQRLPFAEKLNYIEVAYRDGKTEYEIFDQKIRSLLEEKEKHKRSKKLEAAIEKLKMCKGILDRVGYSEKVSNEKKMFDEYLTDIEYKTQHEILKGKYVVFDVETNGTRKANDDLLSLSIYDPTTGKGYNRFLPLDLQPLVLTGWVHGITDEKIENASHITQDELERVIEFFDLKNKILLSFSGGKGTFDSSFVINYCRRHNLFGFEGLHFENIKSLFPEVGFGLEGQMSKDNLCKILKIDGVESIHSGMNDCVLEWKLFEKMKTEPIFFMDRQHIFKYNKEYIIPVTYLNKCPELAAFAKISIPNIIGKATTLFEYSFPWKALRFIKKYPSNISGVALENGINAAMRAEKQDNIAFLAKNKSYLEYIGSLDSRITKIPVEIQMDGTMKSLDSQYDEYIDEINHVTEIMTDYLTPVLEYVKQQIFTSGAIMSQELSLSADGKVLALCDLSDGDNILEIKTFRAVKDDGSISDDLARQLFYESRGRKTYVLSIDIERHINSRRHEIIDGVNVKIYQISLEESENKLTEA